MYIPTESFIERSFMKQYLFSMLEKWKNTLGKVGFVCAIFIDLSKTTNIMNHDLLIAKLGGYGVRKDAFSFVKNCLVKRQQRFHVGVLKVSSKFRIPTIYNFAVIYHVGFSIFLKSSLPFNSFCCLFCLQAKLCCSIT